MTTCSCGKILPVHLTEMGLTSHTCYCEKTYKVVNGKFVENGTAVNPNKRYDEDEKAVWSDKLFGVEVRVIEHEGGHVAQAKYNGLWTRDLSPSEISTVFTLWEESKPYDPVAEFNANFGD